MKQKQVLKIDIIKERYNEALLKKTELTFKKIKM